MLQAGMTQTHVAKQSRVSPSVIHRLSSRFAQIKSPENDVLVALVLNLSAHVHR